MLEITLEFFREILNSISLIDLFYTLITILSLIKCYSKGFVLSILSMAKWLLAYVITLIIFPRLKPYVKNIIDNEIINSDIIFICSPLSSYKEILMQLNQFDLEDTIITDVGSAKMKVVEIAENNLTNKIFVPGHPIAGTEKSGPDFGFKELFNNRWFISTKCNLCDENSLNKVNLIWKKFGSNTQIMSAKDHDSIMAITSHIPHLIAYNIVGTANELEEKIKSEVIKFSASGFRDFTRIAASDPTMWRDILINNKEEVLSLLEKFNSDFILHTHVDETLIAGLKIQIGSQMIDSTIKSKLNSNY